MRGVNDTSTLRHKCSQSDSLSVRALTCTRVPMSCTPLGFTIRYLQWNFILNMKRVCKRLTATRPFMKNTHTHSKTIQYLFQYMRPGTVLFPSITGCLRGALHTLAPDKGLGWYSWWRPSATSYPYILQRHRHHIQPFIYPRLFTAVLCTQGSPALLW